jgi:uncharacterized protein
MSLDHAESGSTDVGSAAIAAMRSGDIDALLAVFHPEVEIHEPESMPYGGTWTGHDGFTALLNRIAGLAEMTITAHVAHPTVDGVILAMNVSFKSNATGEVFHTRVIEVDRIEDGMLREIDVFYKDAHATAAFLAQR